MLTKFFLFLFISVGYCQILENEDAVKSDDDKNLMINISEKNIAHDSSQLKDTGFDELQLLMKGMSECCLTSAQNISELEKNIVKLEEINNDSAKNMSKLMEKVQQLEKEKEDYAKNVNELMNTVSELETAKRELENEISENNRWMNDLVQYSRELEKRECSFKEFRTRLDKEYERQYKLRLDLEKTKKEMYDKFKILRDQQLQVSQCMNDVTFAEDENERVNAKSEYHLAVEDEKNILYKCTSISDTGRNYLYKCLPSLDASFIPDPNTETEESSAE
ncbi:M protein, serotype 2.2-like [Chelonus insularis]|uniref:M protein, serotype 2.2-like n=1 Tax=Chelonus insularis TaxID=460826 RepID=UPI00158A64FB|nr:M protein, serotype 2.2-like [Chelonus insularis]